MPDPLLEPLLVPVGDGEAREFLSQLISATADPVIRGIIHHKLRIPSHETKGQADAADLHQEAVLHLLTELQRFRSSPDGHSIDDVRGLAAVIAHRVCSRWMRKRFPYRHALRNRLYYLLKRRNGFAMWKDENKKLIAGFADWHGQRGLASRERCQELTHNEELAARVRLFTAGRQKTGLASGLAAIFDYLGGPVEFDRLAGALTTMLPRREQPLESIGRTESSLGLATAAEQDTAWQVEKRIFLQSLWEEVCRLPLKQRAALLLNLRDRRGGSCVLLLPATGVASLRELAETLEMSAEQLDELWNELPLEDASIAQLLKLTRQQVINARQAARERLRRRLKGFM